MNIKQDLREASPRGAEGDLALTAPSRGRSTAPHLSIWLPIAAKVAAAGVAALVLAVIGAKAGAHGPPPAFAPAPSATPAVLAAGFMAASPVAPTAGPRMGSADTSEPTPLPTPAPLEGESPGAGILADGRVVLNAASEAELTKLPGIGPSRARAILALRERLKKFRAVEDLLRIKGIGRKMLRRLRPNVVLDRPAVDRQAAPAPPAISSSSAEDSGNADP